MDYDDYLNSTEVWEAEEPISISLSWPVIVMSVLQGLATVIGILANAFLIVLFVTPPRLHSVSSILLLQRAIADVFALVPFPFFIYARANRSYKISEAVCKLSSVILHVGVVASHVLLMAFTLDSYQASHPQHYTPLQPLRRKTIRLTSAAAWGLAAAAGVAAGLLSHTVHGYCSSNPLFFSFTMNDIIMQMAISFIIPLVVVWVFVSVALPPRSMRAALVEPSGTGEGGPNRRLMLGLASNFTVLQGIYWLTLLFSNLIHSHVTFIMNPIVFSLVSFMEVLNAILVICLTEELRQKVARWLPPRHSASVPLQDL
ncbi:Lysophosphatidic acid receptor 4 [Chionoecetes opilio]|uniref:Lysophosphatidic acid receptor 4 n=1 Tax=Chionoecetes opilio TaxID=41210 RepID=A0A8J4Y4D6_CHIOP|nr:Lysophosphatidic acid receptor 4 [Chionoecetes opilio]